MKFSKKLLPILVPTLIAIVLGASLAAVLVTKQVGMQMRIHGTVAMGVTYYNGTALTTIGLGDFIWTEDDMFPGKVNASDPAFSINDYLTTYRTQAFAISDVDQTNFTAQFYVDSSVFGANAQYVYFYIYAWRSDKPVDNNQHEIDTFNTGVGTGWTCPDQLASLSLYPSAPHTLYFVLEVHVLGTFGDVGPAFASYSPTLTINALGTA